MIRVVAIDDEPLALQLVRGYVRRLPSSSWQGPLTTPGGCDFLISSDVDLVLLDVRCPT